MATRFHKPISAPCGSKELGAPVSLAYFRKVLSKLKNKPQKKSKSAPKNKPKNQRHDWGALKTEFIAGDYASATEFGRKHGMNPNAHGFKKATRGWRAEKARMRHVFDSKTRDMLIDEQVAERYQDIYAKALIFHLQLFELLESLAKSSANWEPIQGPAEALEAAKFVSEMQRAIERILPAIRGLEKLAEVNRLFDQLANEKIDITRAAIEFMRLGINLPRPMEIMLSKQQPTEPEPNDGDLISDDTILARRQELLSEI